MYVTNSLMYVIDMLSLFDIPVRCYNLRKHFVSYPCLIYKQSVNIKINILYVIFV